MSIEECIRTKILKEKMCGTTQNKLVQLIQVLEGIKKQGRSLQENQIWMIQGWKKRLEIFPSTGIKSKRNVFNFDVNTV